MLPIVLSFASFGLGYHLGSSSLPHAIGYSKDVNETYLNPENEDEEDIPDTDLGSIKAGLLDACKLVCCRFLSSSFRIYLPRKYQVLVVRTDLKITPGEIAS